MFNAVVMDVQDAVMKLETGEVTATPESDPVTVPEGKVALVIDDAREGGRVIIIGTLQQFRDQVTTGFHMPIPDGVPIVDADTPRGHILGVIQGG